MIQSVAKKNREVEIYFSLLSISTSFYPFGLFLYIFGGLPWQICKFRDKNYWKMAQRRHEQVNWKAIHSWLNNERIHKIRTVQEHDSALLQAIFWMRNLMPSISLNLQKDGFEKEICLLLLKWNVTDLWWLTGCSQKFIRFMITVNEAFILSVIQKVLYFFFNANWSAGKESAEKQSPY